MRSLGRRALLRSLGLAPLAFAAPALAAVPAPEKPWKERLADLLAEKMPRGERGEEAGDYAAWVIFAIWVDEGKKIIRTADGKRVA
jgi:hypothetical protein